MAPTAVVLAALAKLPLPNALAWIAPAVLARPNAELAEPDAVLPRPNAVAWLPPAELNWPNASAKEPDALLKRLPADLNRGIPKRS